MDGEKNVKRRDWVKNAAIVFLAVMLILTFFSNTIMNYSLPEIAAQYPKSQTVSEQIRGSGMVEAGESYEVSVDESRTIASVLVKEGDWVEKGQRLLLLEDIESAELAAAKETLDALKLAYQKSLLATGVDYTLDELDIKNKEEDLERAREDLANISLYQAAYVRACENTAAKKEAVRILQNEYDDVTDSIAALAADDFFLLGAEYKVSLEDAAQKLKTAEANKKKADDAVADIEKQLASNPSGGNITDLRRQVERQEAKIESLYAEYQAALAAGNLSDAAEIKKSITDAERELEYMREDYNTALSQASIHSGYELRLKTALRTQTTANTRYAAAKDTLDKAKNDAREKLVFSQKAIGDKLDGAKASLAEAEAEEAEAKAKASLTVEEAARNIREQERALENKKASLAQTQLKDAETAGIASLDLKAKQEEIKKQEELVARLTEKTVGATVTAGAAGMVRRVNCAAGSKTNPGSSLVTIEVTELGYTLSLSVSNAQAQKVRVGEQAEILYYWYGSASAVLSSVKPDEADPSRRKLLVFTIEGDVTPGQELQLQIGARGRQFETVVPNSAIREDNNGKFILKVTSKSSPLGTRYMAERVDVTVEVTDGTNSAVTGALMNSDFIIMTASKPVNPGDYVRLSSN
jgi:multidrug efflux pump subunit AcrA (membrane-fusion protein)